MKKFVSNLIQTAKVIVTNRAQKCENLNVHVNITTTWALAIGKELKLSKKDMKILAVAANLHDMGKAFVWDTIISPKDLDAKMRADVDTHSTIGAFMAFAKAIFKCHLTISEAIAVFKIVFLHHDVVNGTGAHGIKVDDIRVHILTVADIIAAACYTDPTRNYKKKDKEPATPISLAEDLSHSARYNKVVLEKVAVVSANVYKKLLRKYNIVDAETEKLIALI